jgi:preprotein translocase subunit SecG
MTSAFGIALQVIQIIVSVVLVLAIILQAKGSGLGSLMGGDGGGFGITKTRRGLEKTLFQLTIILAAVFLIISLVLLMIQQTAA